MVAGKDENNEHKEREKKKEGLFDERNGTLKVILVMTVNILTEETIFFYIGKC